MKSHEIQRVLNIHVTLILKFISRRINLVLVKIFKNSILTNLEEITCPILTECSRINFNVTPFKFKALSAVESQ